LAWSLGVPNPFLPHDGLKQSNEVCLTTLFFPFFRTSLRPKGMVFPQLLTASLIYLIAYSKPTLNRYCPPGGPSADPGGTVCSTSSPFSPETAWRSRFFSPAPHLIPIPCSRRFPPPLSTGPTFVVCSFFCCPIGDPLCKQQCTFHLSLDPSSASIFFFAVLLRDDSESPSFPFSPLPLLSVSNDRLPTSPPFLRYGVVFQQKQN